MSESFVPLVPPATGPREATFASMQTKGMAAKSGQSTPSTPGATGSESEGCPKPVVTLQRNGEIVSSIRVQCGCGQVIDLTCAY